LCVLHADFFGGPGHVLRIATSGFGDVRSFRAGFSLHRGAQTVAELASNIVENMDLVRLVTPTVLGALTSKAYPVGPSAGGSIAARPPPQAFQVIWYALYALIGIAWVLAVFDLDESTSEDVLAIDAFFLLLNVMLCMWCKIYLDDKRAALYELLITVLVLGLGMVAGSSLGLSRSQFLLVPLLVWASFASLLNFTEVNQTMKEPIPDFVLAMMKAKGQGAPPAAGMPAGMPLTGMPETGNRSE
jgi:tryptophan-rich sensory protein